jgi:type VI secretion system secreted protein VgrG
MALMGQLAGLAPQTAGMLGQAGAIANATGPQGASIGAMVTNLGSSLLGFFTGGGLEGREGVVKSGDTTKDAGNQLRANAATVGGDIGGILSGIPGTVNTVAGTFQTESVGIAKVEQVGVSKVTNIGQTQLVNVGKFKKTIVGEEFVIEVGASKFIMRKDGTVIILGTNFNFTASGPVQINGVVVDLNKPADDA